MRNRFKRLDLIDRVPEDLWTEVRDILRKAVIKTNPQEKEMQKGKMVDCALQEPVSQSGVNQIPYNYTVGVTNRFKRLDLIDRVPDELCMEVHSIVQETGIKTIPNKKICKKEKWLPEEALQIAVKRREVKSKGEKESYKHLNESSKEQQEETRKPSSVINAKK